MGGSLYAINKVRMEDYVKGVIPNESPSGWPQPALRAQAVAARSYALATRLNGNGYDLYDDTRSQVYGGRSSETARRTSAAQATAGEVIKAGGGTATAYFFSTSGGQTENSEFVFSEPRSYLKSVEDPYDRRSPVHSWRERFSNARDEGEALRALLRQPEAGLDPQDRALAPDRPRQGRRLRRLDEGLGRHAALPARPALDLGAIQEALSASDQPSG